MTERRLVIAGNWKMHKTSAETRSHVQALAAGIGSADPGCEVIVAPPFTSIAAAVEAARGTVIKVSAQNIHWEDEGAFTGEISGRMLREAGCSHVIIGHSERRQYFCETDETVNQRIIAALRYGLVPIFCLGETIEEREAGKTFDVLTKQLETGLAGIVLDGNESLVMAYEPVWAIGTGRTATPETAQEAHEYLRGELRGIVGSDVADGVRILYGGSMKPSNARDLLTCRDIDGGLIGGASLKSEDFLGIIKEGTS